MKKYLNILLCLFTSQFLCGQTEPDLDLNIPTSWVYFSKDPNFVKNDFDQNSNAYNLKSPKKIIEYKGFLYFFETCFSQNPLVGPEGIIIHKFDPSSDNIVWSWFHNYFSGMRFREDFIECNYNFINDTLFLLGKQNMDVMEENAIQEIFYGNNVLYALDINTGNEISNTLQADTSKQTYKINFPNKFRQIISSQNDIFITQSGHYLKPDFTLIDTVGFYKINDDLSLGAKIKTLQNNTGYIDMDSGIGYNPAVIDGQNDTLYTIFFNKMNEYLYESFPGSITMKLSTIKNGKLETLDSIDLSATIPDIDYNFNLDEFFIFRSSGILYQTANIKNLNENKFVSNFTWISGQGKILAYVNRARINTTDYVFLRPLGTVGNILYVGGYMEGKYSKIHVLALEHGKSVFKYVHEIALINNTYGLRMPAAIIHNGQLILGIDYYKESSTDRYVCYAGIDLQDLGISTLAEELTQENPTIYPNPSDGEITISLAAPRSYSITIYNYLGQKIENLSSTDGDKIVYMQKAGSYIAEVQFDSGQKFYKSFVIIK